MSCENFNRAEDQWTVAIFLWAVVSTQNVLATDHRPLTTIKKNGLARGGNPDEPRSRADRNGHAGFGWEMSPRRGRFFRDLMGPPFGPMRWIIVGA